MIKEKELTTDDLEEALKILENPIMVNSVTYKYFTQEQYDKLEEVFEKCKLLFPKFDTMLEIVKEHKILKQFIIDNDMYEKLLNSDKFIEWMNEDYEIKENDNTIGNKYESWPDDPKPIEKNINFS